ncbi:hypothetical protein JRQ81_010672 [Phrynocephalus forsythii]|uniref:Colorectal cancer-associated protein 2 n=1 Tax=Phrynocephalus forsythii TaxID=171643 RepID=A0A9Q0X741_9SAUR|nr:hypothetical protein JRQ81_010672 [Phrynocephalus forsythii]
MWDLRAVTHESLYREKRREPGRVPKALGSPNPLADRVAVHARQSGFEEWESPKKRVSGEGSSSVQIPEGFSPPCPVPFVDGGLESSSPVGCLQPWAFQSCLSCEEIPSYLEQLVDSCMQTEPPLDASLGVVPGSLPCSPESYQPSPLCLSQSLGPGSPDPSAPSSSFDYTYSPPQPPPYAPGGYADPPPLGPKSCMYPSSEGIPLQPHDAQYHPAAPSCCCASCGSRHLDSFRVPDYFPYANTDCRDYASSVSVGDDCFGRDRSWDTCYS